MEDDLIGLSWVVITCVGEVGRVVQMLYLGLLCGEGVIFNDEGLNKTEPPKVNYYNTMFQFSSLLQLKPLLVCSL